MKKLLLALLSFVALANDPGVGTFAEYEATKGSFSSILKHSVVAYNAENETFTLRFESRMGDNTEIYEEILDRVDVRTRAENARIFEECEIYGEKVTITVPAGTFLTCKIQIGDTTFYSADVPFGIVKTENNNGIVQVLKSYEYK